MQVMLNRIIEYCMDPKKNKEIVVLCLNTESFYLELVTHYLSKEK